MPPGPTEQAKLKSKTDDAPACGCRKVNGKKEQCRTHRREHRNKKGKKLKDRKKSAGAKVELDKKKTALLRHAEDSEEEHDAVEGAVTPDKICITGPAGVGVLVSIESETNKEAAPRATKDSIKEPTKGIVMLGAQDCPQFIPEGKIPLDNGKPIYNKYSAGRLVRNNSGETVFYPDGGNKFDQKGNPVAIEGDGIDKQLQQKIGAEYRYAGVVDVNKLGLPEFRMLDEKNSAPQDKNALVGCLILLDGIVYFVATKGQTVGSGDLGTLIGTTREGTVPVGTVIGELVLDKMNGRISCVKKAPTTGQNVIAIVIQGNFNQPIIVASKDGPLSVGTTCATKDAATYKDVEWQKLAMLDEMTQKCSTNDITKSSLAALSVMLGCSSKQIEELSVRGDTDVNRGCLQYIKIAPETVANIAEETKNEGENEANPVSSVAGLTQKCSTGDASKAGAPSAMLGCTSKYTEASKKSEANRGAQQDVMIAPEGISNIANVGVQNKAGEAPEADGSKDDTGQKSSGKSEANRGAQQGVMIAPEGISNIANVGVQSKAGEAPEKDPENGSSKDGMADKCSTGDASKVGAPSEMLGCTSKQNKEVSKKSELNRGGQQDVMIAPEGLSNIANVGVQSKAGEAPKDDTGQKSSGKSEANRGAQHDVMIAPEGISNIANVGVQSKTGEAPVAEGEGSKDDMAQKCSTDGGAKSSALTAMVGCTSKQNEETSKKSEANGAAQQDVMIAPEVISNIANVGVQSKAGEAPNEATVPAPVAEEALIAPQGIKTVLSGKANSQLKSAAGSLKPVSVVQLKKLKGASEAGKSTLTEAASVANDEASTDPKEPTSIAVGGKTQQTMKYTVTSKNSGGGASTMGGASKVGGASVSVMGGASTSLASKVGGASGAVSKLDVVSVACYEGGNKPNMSKYVTPANKAAALNQTAKLAVKSTYVGNNAGEGRSQWLGGGK